MTITNQIRNVTRMTSEERGGVTWLRIEGDEWSDALTVYMPGPVADAMVEAWQMATDEQADAEERYWTSREPDDRYTMDGLRRQQDAARALK